MQSIAILAPIFSILAISLMILGFTRLGRINAIAYLISALSLMASSAYFLRGIFGIKQYTSDLILNWVAFLLWLVIAIIFLMVGLPHKPSKEK